MIPTYSTISVECVGIVMCDRNLAIGSNGNQPLHLKYDLAYFQSVTTNNIIICGRKTLETFPDGNPLPNRANIILTSHPENYQNTELVQYVKSIDEVFEVVSELQERYNPNEAIPLKAYIVGGGSIYSQFIPYIDKMIISMVDTEFSQPDTFIPSFDNNPEWMILSDTHRYIDTKRRSGPNSKLYMVDRKVYVRTSTQDN